MPDPSAPAAPAHPATVLEEMSDPRPRPTTPYQHVLHDFLGDLFAAYPTFATATGFHGHDGRWPDLSGTGRLKRIAMLRRHRGSAEQLPEADLSPDEVTDRALLLESIDATLFEEETLREATWDPLGYVYLLGSGLFPLVAREFAPFSIRGAAFVERLERIPEVVAAAKQNLLGLQDRPVSLLHTETALAQLDGITEIIDQALAEALHRADAPGPARELHRLIESASRDARESIEELRRFLDVDVRARSKGEGRLGPELFHTKMRHALATEMTPAELLQRAERDRVAVRAEIIRLAAQIWGAWIDDERLPSAASDGSQEAADERIVKGVLDAIAEEHRKPDELIEYCRREVKRIERFCEREDVIDLPADPLRITWTPVFMRAFGGAFLDSPGILDKGLFSYFWITPPGEDWSPERTESYLREDNDRMLRLLCIHEGVPGHYLQLAWANRSDSLTRAIFSSGMFAEGWAVYVTQVMMDLGYGHDDPALLLTHWKFYLRAVTNAIMDIRIHTSGMTEEEAMDLMVRQGFQEEQEARAKWLRARLTSTQLSTYYLGSVEMWEVEEDARRRAAAAVGASADVIPPQRIAGGLGETPGFEYRRHLESVISHGTPPIKWVRRILAEAPPA